MTQPDTHFHITYPRAEGALIDAIVIWMITLGLAFCVYGMQEALEYQIGFYLLSVPFVIIFFVSGLNTLFTEVTLTQDLLINYSPITRVKKQIALHNIVNIESCAPLPNPKVKTWRMTLTVRTRSGRIDHFAYHRALDPYLKSALERHAHKRP